MQNGSSNTNRHGIPLLGGTPNRCCWTGCVFAADRSFKLPLCRGHAKHVFQVLDAAREAERALEAEQRAAERQKTEVIYYAKIGGHLKIGYTSRLEQRMRSYPPNTELLAVHPGTREDERQLHRQFAVHRSHGAEWYPLVPVILEHIERVIAKHGKPPEVTFGAKPVQVPQPRSKEGPTPRYWTGYRR